MAENRPVIVTLTIDGREIASVLKSITLRQVPYRIEYETALGDQVETWISPGERVLCPDQDTPMVSDDPTPLKRSYRQVE